MKGHIQAALVEEIDFTDQIDAFNDMISFTIVRYIVLLYCSVAYVIVF